MTWNALVSAVIAAPVIVVTAIAQQAQPDALWPKRTTLQTVDFPPGCETVSVIAELESGSCTGRYTHPGAESAYSWREGLSRGSMVSRT
jgi:hypothetical protein